MGSPPDSQAAIDSSVELETPTDSGDGKPPSVVAEAPEAEPLSFAAFAAFAPSPRALPAGA